MDITTLKIPLILLYLISGFVFGAYSEMKSSQYHTDDRAIPRVVSARRLSRYDGIHQARFLKGVARVMCNGVGLYTEEPPGFFFDKIMHHGCTIRNTIGIPATGGVKNVVHFCGIFGKVPA